MLNGLYAGKTKREGKRERQEYREISISCALGQDMGTFHGTTVIWSGHR